MTIIVSYHLKLKEIIQTKTAIRTVQNNIRQYSLINKAFIALLKHY